MEKITTNNSSDIFSAAYALETDNYGNTFIATDNGIFYYNGKELLKYNKCSYNYIDIINFYKETNGNIWALPYYGKVFILNDKSQKELKFFGNENYKTNYVYSNNNGELIFYLEFQNERYSGYFYKNGKYIAKKITIEPDGFFEDFFNSKVTNSEDITSLKKDLGSYARTEIRIKNENYFIKENKIFYLDSNKSKLVFNGDEHNCLQTTIIDFYKNKNDGYYLALMGKKNGLYYFTSNKILIPIYTQSGVNGIIKDPKGKILFIAKNNKLLKIENIHFTKEKIKFNSVKKIQKIVNYPNKDTLIISDNLGSLYYFNTLDSKLKKINLTTNQNSYLGEFGNQILYVDNHQFYQFHPKETCILFSKANNYSFNGKRTNINDKNIPLFIFRNNILQALSLKENIYLFFKNYVFIYNIKSRTYNQLNYFFKLNFIEPIDSESLILNTDKGKLVLNDNSPNEIFNQTRNSIVSDYLNFGNVNNCKYYISSKYIYKLDDKNNIVLEYLFPKNKSSFDIISVDNYKDNLIIIGHQGFEMYDTKTKKMCDYTIPYLETDETLIGSLIKDDDIYFYSNENIYSCPMSIFDFSKNTPQINFSSIKFNNDELILNFDSIIEKYSNKNYLEIDFNSLFSIFNTDNQFQYSLFDISNNHSEIIKTIVNNNHISINNLKYGQYKLSIYFNDILIKSLFINYIPKWYHTNTFYFVVFLLTLFIVIYFIYYLIQLRFKRNRIKMEEKNYQYKLESSAMLNQLKPHFIFNALTPIQNYILTKRNDEALNYLDNFSTLIRFMLNMSRDSSTSLHNEIKFIENYLKLKFNERSENFKYNIVSDFTNEETLFIKIPTLLLQPLVENAIAYGKDYVKIHFMNESENLIRVIISDNGKGFDLEKILNNETKKNHAIHIISERLALIKKESGLPTILKTYFKDELFEVKICIPKIK